MRVAFSVANRCPTENRIYSVTCGIHYRTIKLRPGCVTRGVPLLSWYKTDNQKFGTCPSVLCCGLKLTVGASAGDPRTCRSPKIVLHFKVLIIYSITFSSFGLVLAARITIYIYISEHVTVHQGPALLRICTSHHHMPHC